MNKLLIILFSGLLSFDLAFADYPLEIIDLKGRPAQEILPLIQPFVGPDGTAVGKDNKLILRASPPRMRDIRKILENIDRPPRRLMIYARQGSPRETVGRRSGYGVRLDARDNARVDIGRTAPRHGVSLHASSVHTRRRRDITQRVETVEGRPAYIDAGRAVPIQDQAIGPFGYANTTYYRNASTGFYVIAWINGERVTLEIRRYQETPSRRYPQSDMQFGFQQTGTTLSARLGEWISIAGTDVGGDRDREGNGLLARTHDRDDWTLQIRVEALP